MIVLDSIEDIIKFIDNGNGGSFDGNVFTTLTSLLKKKLGNIVVIASTSKFSHLKRFGFTDCFDKLIPISAVQSTNIESLVSEYSTLKGLTFNKPFNAQIKNISLRRLLNVIEEISIEKKSFGT